MPSVRDALKAHREILRGIPPEHLTQESLFFLADQIDRLERKVEELLVHYHKNEGKGVNESA